MNLLSNLRLDSFVLITSDRGLTGQIYKHSTFL